MIKKKGQNKEYYKNLNIIRIISCIAVLFYHLGILKGGYLAVCTFFVLSGYLSCKSACKKENFIGSNCRTHHLLWPPFLYRSYCTLVQVQEQTSQIQTGCRGSGSRTNHSGRTVQ